MKLKDMKQGDSNTFYFIHYFDETKGMWCPFTYNDYGFISENKLIDALTEVKKLSAVYKVFREVTTRLQ